MPMTMASILSRPCLSGLRLRPRRLFGFDGTTDADPRSPTGSITPGAFGPAPATAPARIADPAIRDLQGAGGAHSRLACNPPASPQPSPRKWGEGAVRAARFRLEHPLRYALLDEIGDRAGRLFRIREGGRGPGMGIDIRSFF